MTRTSGIAADPGWLLRAWEGAEAVPPVQRGAVIVHEAGLVPALDVALDLPVNALAALAGRLYVELFGPDADSVVPCTACGAKLDLVLPVDQLVTAPVADGTARTPVTLHSGRVLTVGVPTTRDLLAAGSGDDFAAGLLGRCLAVEDGAEPGRPADPWDLGLREDDLAAIDAALEAAAGAAAVTVTVSCPECRAETSAPLDLTDFLWQRVASEAPQLMAEVAELATAFGWTEAEVVGLGAARRRVYLELARGGPR